MKIKTEDLTGAALDWVVAKCENPDTSIEHFIAMHSHCASDHGTFDYSTDWAQGGPIIELESISIVRCDDQYGTDRKGFTTAKRIPVWAATTGQHSYETVYGSQGDNWGDSYSIDVGTVTYGPTALIAAMRCYVTSKRGDEVEVPEELTAVRSKP